MHSYGHIKTVFVSSLYIINHFCNIIYHLNLPSIATTFESAQQPRYRNRVFFRKVNLYNIMVHTPKYFYKKMSMVLYDRVYESKINFRLIYSMISVLIRYPNYYDIVYNQNIYG